MVSYASEFNCNMHDVISQCIGTERCSASGGFAWWMYLFKCFSPSYLSSYVVYQFKCMDESCTDNYVGYTIRHLFERADEHLKLTDKKQSEIKDHIRKCASCKNASYKNFAVINRCKSETHCKLFEAFAIKKMRPTLNKQMFAHGMSKILHIWKWLLCCLLICYIYTVLLCLP